MKKLFIIMTFVISSFFLLSSNVKALDVVIPDDYLNLINEDLLEQEKEFKAYIESDDSLSNNYVIYFEDGKYYFYSIGSSGSSTLNTQYLSYSTNLRWWCTYRYKRFSLNVDSFSGGSSGIGHGFLFYDSDDFVSMILFSNIDLIYTSDEIINLKYKDFTYEVKKNDIFPTLYDFYKKYNEFIGDDDLVHKEETEKVTSFYMLVIDKLLYLCDVISSNYIYLSIIVIFILIFIFRLIFRRLL